MRDPSQHTVAHKSLGGQKVQMVQIARSHTLNKNLLSQMPLIIQMTKNKTESTEYRVLYQYKRVLLHSLHIKQYTDKNVHVAKFGTFPVLFIKLQNSCHNNSFIK